MLSAVALFLLAPLDLKPTATIRFPALNEVSGIVQSGTTKSHFWVHNDSGDSPRIFAIRTDGNVVAPTNATGYKGIQVEGAKNVDWEDISRGPEGMLYVSDLGNNDNKRKDLGVYLLPEPNPTTDTTVAAKFLPVIYPDQASFPPTFPRFDSEAIFFFKGKLHVLTKNRLPGGFLPEPNTSLYRMDTSFTDKPNRLKKLDSKAGLPGWVTAADVSPDARWLAVLTQAPLAAVWIFDVQGVGDKLLSKPIRKVTLDNAKQCEAICFDGQDHLIIVNEQRDLFRIKVTEVPKS